jgi:hypothetical protein
MSSPDAYDSLVTGDRGQRPKVAVNNLRGIKLQLSRSAQFASNARAGQEARARAPSAPAALIGGMTAASALGQILGPLTTAALAYLQVAPAAVLGMSLRLAASTLLLSAFLLWRMTLTSR